MIRALWLPAKLAIIHCLDHENGDSPVTRGDHHVDKATKVVSKQDASILTLKLPDLGPCELTDKPTYTLEELALVHRLLQSWKPKRQKEWWQEAGD